MRDSVTRRRVLKALGVSATAAAVGSAAGHPDAEEDTRHDASNGSHSIHEHTTTVNTERVGYHSLGGFGSESLGGDPEDHVHGAVSEVWVEGDLAFVSLLSSSEPTGNRGVAVLDVSQYTRAETRDELADAEMFLLSYIDNENQAGTMADVKASEDGQYLFVSKQAIGALYGEAASPSTDQHDAASPMATGIEAYDISNPANPAYLGSAQGPNAGFHNCFTFRIGGSHYVFGVQGVAAGDAGVHVYRLEESTGQLEPVNFWSGGDLTQGEYDTDAANYYGHDFYMHRDPKTGRPVGYWSEWNNGVRVLDFSDPTDVVELGFGPMDAAHYAQPVPVTIDGKRLFLGGQELGSQTNGHSGYVHLFDGDALFEEGVTECPTLDSWTLYENVSYSGYAFSPHNFDVTEDGWITLAHYHAGVRFLEIQPPGEGDVATDQWHLAGKRVGSSGTDGGSTTRTETDESESFSGLMTPGGPTGPARTTQTHEFTAPEGVDALEATLSWGANQQDLDLYLDERVDGGWTRIASSATLGGPESVAGAVTPGTDYRFVVATYAHVASQYSIEGTYFAIEGGDSHDSHDHSHEERTVLEPARAYYSDHVEVPDDSQTFGSVTPNFWGARIENGVTFASGINSGLYAIAADPVPVGTRSAVDLIVETGDDGRVFTAGQTNQLELTVQSDATVRIRTRIPPSWTVVGGDAHATQDVGDGTMVTFEDEVPGDESQTTRTLFVEAPDSTGSYTFGPVEYSADGGVSWEPVADSTTSNSVVGLDTSL